MLLIDFIRSYRIGRIAPEVFSVAYGELYEIMKSNGELAKLPRDAMECLTLAEGVVELYSDYKDRLPHELSEVELNSKISAILDLFDRGQLGEFSEKTKV